MKVNFKSLLFPMLAGTLSAAPTFRVDAGADADLVLSSLATGGGDTFDSEAVPPSGAANIYASLNGGAFLNSGNTNASLAYSFTIQNGAVLALRRNSFNITTASVYGFDIVSGDGSTVVHNGAVQTSNTNATATTVTVATPLEITDPHDGSVWRITFTPATANAADDLVGPTAAVPDSNPDRVDTLTFTLVSVVPPPQPWITAPVIQKWTNGGAPATHTVTFTNPSAAASLNIASVVPGGAGAGNFTVTGYTASVAPGGTGTATISFTPAGNGPVAANLTFTSSDSAHAPVTVLLRVDVTDTAAQVAAARALWTRLVGAEVAGRFDFSSRTAIGGKDTYALSVVGGRVKVAGSSGVAMARGAYDFLRRNGYGQIGWSGVRAVLPAVLTDVGEVVVTPPGPLQTYFNPVVYGYSTPYWDWARWEHEIDLMAVHGINLPLALVAQEAIAERVWLRLGLTQAEIDTFETGPAHLPWQRMGNIMNHDGQLPASWHTAQVAMQHQILERMHALGIRPVVPAFNGFVPVGIKRVYPAAAMQQTLWNSGFPAGKRPWFLLPTDPLFSEIAAVYRQEWRDEFGAADYFLSDCFNELDVPTNGGTLADALADYGEIIGDTIRAEDPDAVWFIQGWMFGYQRNIWNATTVAALLSRQPDDGVLVQDIATDYNAHFWHNGMNWRLFNAFYGKRWTHGVIPNMGGKTAPTGIFSFYAGDAPNTFNDPARGRVSGAGYAAEGIESAEVLFELVTDAAWSSTPFDSATWLENYCTGRYGGSPAKMQNAWSLLRQTVYGTFTDHPKFGWQGGAPGYGTVNRDARIMTALQDFLSCRGTLGASPLYQADALEYTAHALGIEADKRFVLARSSFDGGDTAAGETYLSQGYRLLDEIDRLLESHPLHRLDRWLAFARGHGASAAETNAYEANARRIITSWGPPVNDYAARMWSGLIRDFYKPRIAAWFTAYRAGTSFNVNAWEQNWIAGTGVSPITPYADPVGTAAALLATAISESSQNPPGEATEILGDWFPTDLTTDWVDLSWPLTTDQLNRMAGVVFQHTAGANRLQIRRVEIVADGVVVTALEQYGLAGTASVGNIFQLQPPAGIQANNSLILRASVRGDGGTDTRGRVLLIDGFTPGPAILKSATGTDLSSGASWDGGTPPGSGNVATWNASSLGAGITLPTATEWQGISVSGAAAPIHIGGPGLLTLGRAGVDHSQSSADLTLSAPQALIQNQTWKVAGGRTLVVSGSTTGTAALTLRGVDHLATANYLPPVASATNVFPGVTLDDVIAVSGKLGGAYVNSGIPLAGTVYFYERVGNRATWQVQVIDSPYTKCVKIQMDESAAGLSAGVVYAKYIHALNLGYNFDNGGSTNSIAMSATGAGYGAAETTLNLGSADDAVLVISGEHRRTGDTLTESGNFHLAANGTLYFVLTNTTSNKLGGTAAATLDGQFAIDTSAVTLLAGAWILESFAGPFKSYGGGFAVVAPDGTPWDTAGPGKWTRTDTGRTYVFDTSTGTLTMSTRSYQDWADAHAGGLPRGVDSDGDGVPNGVEWFMGESTPGFTAMPGIHNNRISWTKGTFYPGRYGIDYVIQSSPDMGEWTDVPADDVGFDNGHPFYQIPAPVDHLFLRLKITGP